MTATTPKGFPYPQDGIDYLVDAAEHLQALAEAVDTKLDEYDTLDHNGLTYLVKTLEADPASIGTTEVALVTSDTFVLDAPTRVEIVLSLNALTPDSYYRVAHFRIRPGNLSATPVGGFKKNIFQTAIPDGGGSYSCYPVLPAGTWSIIATLQMLSGSVVVSASSSEPVTLLVRSMP